MTDSFRSRRSSPAVASGSVVCALESPPTAATPSPATLTMAAFSNVRRLTLDQRPAPTTRYAPFRPEPLGWAGISTYAAASGPAAAHGPCGLSLESTLHLTLVGSFEGLARVYAAHSLPSMLGIPRAGRRRPVVALVAVATLSAFTLTSAPAQAAPPAAVAVGAPTQTYIVQTIDAPAATYNGGLAGLAATRAAAGASSTAPTRTSGPIGSTSPRPGTACSTAPG